MFGYWYILLFLENPFISPFFFFMPISSTDSDCRAFQCRKAWPKGQERCSVPFSWYLVKNTWAFHLKKWPVCLVKTQRLSNSSPQRHCFQLRGGATSHSCSQKASSLQPFCEAFTLCLRLRWWNLSIRRDEHQDGGPQSFWHQLLVSWKTTFPRTELGEMVWGWFKHIAFIVHFISIIIKSALPGTRS